MKSNYTSFLSSFCHEIRLLDYACDHRTSLCVLYMKRRAFRHHLLSRNSNPWSEAVNRRSSVFSTWWREHYIIFSAWVRGLRVKQRTKELKEMNRLREAHSEASPNETFTDDVLSGSSPLMCWIFFFFFFFSLSVIFIHVLFFYIISFFLFPSLFWSSLFSNSTSLSQNFIFPSHFPFYLFFISRFSLT